MKSSSRTFNIAIAVSLLLHAALVVSLMHWGFAKPPAPPPRLVIEMLPPLVKSPEIAPLPAPPPKPVALKTPVAKSSAPPRPAPQAPAPMKTAPQLSTQMTLPTPAVAEPSPPPGPPQHRMKAAAPSAGSATSGAAGGGKGGSVYAPPEYAEKVKQRVIKAIVYPADAKRFKQQCWIEYTLIVDRTGNLLDYTINKCGNDRLDAAAEAALIKGGPYPPLSDTGVESYEIHGAFPFTL